jgi:hypothetical protein
MNRYADTKFCNLLLADELAARRWAGRVAVLTVSPGMVDTGLWRHFPLWYQAVTWPVRATALRSVDDGAVGVVWAAAAHEAEGLSGVLVADGVTVKVSEAARDAVTAKQLFATCERIIADCTTDTTADNLVK